MRDNPLGMAIQDIVAGAVHKVLVGILPHHHQIRQDVVNRQLTETVEPIRATVTGIFAYCLDNDLVHDLLKPLFRVMAGKD